MTVDTYEVRDLFRDALMSRNQRLLDKCVVTVIFELRVPAKEAERLLHEAKERVPADVRAWWEEPCGLCD